MAELLRALCDVDSKEHNSSINPSTISISSVAMGINVDKHSGYDALSLRNA